VISISTETSSFRWDFEKSPDNGSNRVILLEVPGFVKNVNIFDIFFTLVAQAFERTPFHAEAFPDYRKCVSPNRTWIATYD
jgi:hypothetical protein